MPHHLSIDKGLERVAYGVATLFGVGKLPAPGTMASVVTAIAIGLLQPQITTIVGAALAITLIGLWAIPRVEKRLGHDSGQIVIDEVAGQLICLCFMARFSWLGLLMGLVSFRILDISKPGPIGWIDRHVRGARGTMGDDLAAGFGAGVLLWLAEYLHANMG